MPADEPSWWYGAGPTMLPRLLQPAAAVWGWAAERRLRRDPEYRASLPVICVGNFTAGGTGKTPLSMLIARQLIAHGERPAFLTRGYRGRHIGPHLVDPAIDTAADVGDEPLLLARLAPTMVARDRARGAAALETETAPTAPSVIVMDDGLQNPGLAKTLSFAVVDGSRGFGNGKVIPAGPLRAPLAVQFGLADAIVVNRPRGETAGSNATAAMLRQRFGGPVLEAWVEPQGDWSRLSGRPVLALSGIAGPHRFFRLLEEMGARVVERIVHADHHAFSAEDAVAALTRAKALGAEIVTTEKDWVRLGGGSGALAELRDAATALPIALALDADDRERLGALLDSVMAVRATQQRPPTPG